MLLFGDVSQVSGQVELTLDLREGAARDRDEAAHLGTGVAAEPFRDVRHHGNRRTPDLVAQSPIPGERASLAYAINPERKVFRLLPDQHVFEAG
jgi:hypothetical protein